MGEPLDTVADPTALAADRTAGGERAVLAVYLGAGPGGEVDERSRLVPLADGVEVSFGRTRAATIHVDSERVSRLHARLTRRGGEIVVEDLGSRNGTRVNGARIETPTLLRTGDQIEIGPITAVVSVTSALARRTALGSAAYLDERLAAECDRSGRYGRPLALYMLRLEGPTEAIDAAIERIAGEARPMDALAEYGPDELAVLAAELGATELEPFGRRLLAAARAGGGLTARLGVARFPDHGSRPGELRSSARAALRAARAGGRDEVVSAPREQRVADDVVVLDPQMQRLYALVRRVADTPMTVLIHGETGAGKEAVAEALHQQSGRKGRPYVRLNCASLPETLLESELFGHEKGAFTGADRRKLGYFEAADGGTLFLDEIGEITPAVQAKLLRVLEERRFTRVGGTQEIAVDVRVVCATNRDLDKEVARGAFREDLFFRIGAFTLLVPPLRDRKGEILPLAERFIRDNARELGQPVCTIGAAARAALERYGWPGNVRELKNAIERAMVLQSGGVIELEDLPERVRDGDPAPTGGGLLAVPIAGDVREQIAEVERATLVAALDAAGGNQTRAAQRLGLSRRALIYRMEKYGLKPPPGAGR
jgi:two-component system, NtrC family, response regulator AtoC